MQNNPRRCDNGQVVAFSIKGVPEPDLVNRVRAVETCLGTEPHYFPSAAPPSNCMGKGPRVCTYTADGAPKLVESDIGERVNYQILPMWSSFGADTTTKCDYSNTLMMSRAHMLSNTAHRTIAHHPSDNCPFGRAYG